MFLEVILDAEDMAAQGLLSRDELEDPLEEALKSVGLGEVTGGGGGSGRYIIDLEVDDGRFDEALEFLRSTLMDLGAPGSTVIKRYDPTEVAYPIKP